MGWNTGYSILEKQVVDLYDKQLLNPTLLDTIVEPFKGTDCDSGGSNNLKSKDGLTFSEIICKVLMPNEYKDAKENPKWYEGESPKELGDYNPLCNEKLSNLYYHIWRDLWGMW